MLKALALSTSVLAFASGLACAETPMTREPSTGVSSLSTGWWLASDIYKADIYDPSEHKIGKATDLVIDSNGNLKGVIIGVGGFLGMGSHDIKVELSKLKFVDEPVKTSATGTSTTGAAPGGMSRPATTTTTTPATPEKKWYPDHAVMSGASKDQLKAMPEFKYN